MRHVLALKELAAFLKASAVIWPGKSTSTSASWEGPFWASEASQSLAHLSRSASRSAVGHADSILAGGSSTGSSGAAPSFLMCLNAPDAAPSSMSSLVTAQLSLSARHSSFILACTTHARAQPHASTLLDASASAPCMRPAFAAAIAELMHWPTLSAWSPRACSGVALPLRLTKLPATFLHSPVTVDSSAAPFAHARSDPAMSRTLSWAHLAAAPGLGLVEVLV